MCFSAEASLGVAVALLPAGAYGVAAAWRKDRRYLPLAATPVLFGFQQLCEAGVWAGVGRGDPEAARVASVGFLFFALALWPAWVPLAVGAVEPPGRMGAAFLALAVAGLAVGGVYYPPVAAAGGRGLNPTAVGHSLRYDLPAGPAAGWVWPALYLATAAGPLLLSADRRLRPLGVAVLASAGVAYAAYREAFASVWCFLAAVLSAYLVYVLYRLPFRPGSGISASPVPAPAL
ncbi:MAG: hypothetical protein K2X87_07330 [Gemmataceae bacterium]|nr:hypothetical protein [Gemmataceae bacterium]